MPPSALETPAPRSGSRRLDVQSAAGLRHSRSNGEQRRLGRRIPLPGGRAIVGGFLVTAAAVGTFAAYTSATSGPTRAVLVARAPVRLGQRLQATDVRLVLVDVPDEVRERSFESVDDIEGATALASMEPDEFVTRSDVRLANDAVGPAPVREFSFALDREHALDGQLQRGETIDLIATYGSGADAYTTVVARHVRVLDADATAGGAVGSSGKITITIGLDSERHVLEATHALEIGKVNVIRSTHVQGGVDAQSANDDDDDADADADDRYSPDAVQHQPTTPSMPSSSSRTPGERGEP